MARPRKIIPIEERISKAEQKVQKTRKEYEEACSELKELYVERNRIQADILLKAMAKKGKSFEEILRLIEL